MHTDHARNPAVLATRFASLTAVLAVVAGAMVLAGWAFDIAVLKSVLPGWVAMKANTAVCFILIGIALLLVTRPPATFNPQLATFFSMFALVCGLLAGLIGLLSLSEYLFGWNPGIDQLLVREPPGAIDTSDPGRMAPETALCFILLAAVLWSTGGSRKTRWSILASVSIGLLVATLALAAMLSYPTHSLGAYGWFGLTIMAMHTAILFALLGVAVIAISWRQDVLQWSLSRRTTAAFACGMAVLVLIGFNINRSQFWLGEANRKIAYSEEALSDIVNIQIELTEAQAHTRGYIITGDERFLEAYLEDIAGYHRKMDAFHQLIAGSPQQQQQISLIEANVDLLQRWSQRFIDAPRTGIANATRSKMDGHGDDLLNNISTAFGQIRNEHRQIIKELRQELKSVARFSYITTVTGTLVSLLIFLTAIFRLNFAVNEREQRELALQESEDKFRKITESAQDAIIMMGADGRISLWNTAAGRIFGYTAAEAMGQELHAMIAPAPARAGFAQAFPHFQEAGEGPVIGKVRELTALRKGGEEFPVELSVSATQFGGQWRAIGIVRDITERKQAEILLHNSEARLQTIVENLTEGVAVSGLDGQLLHFNRAALDLHGFTTLDECRQHLTKFADTFELSAMGGTVWSVDQWPLARILHGENLRGLEVRIRHIQAGWRRIFSYGGTLVRDANDQPMMAVVTISDITKRKQAETEVLQLNAELENKVAARTADLEQARLEAEQANHAKSAFLAAMSHEIRTPMNGVIGMIDVLHQSSLKGYQVEMVDLIRESAYSLLGIINDILDFSKIEAGKLEIERAPTLVAGVVEDVCGMLDSMAWKKGVELTLFTDPAIPAEVLGDTLRLRQVLVNLVNNAIKFSSKQQRHGKVSVRALLAESTPERVTLELRIADNGIGMDEEILSGLFTPFTQADISTTRRFGGTGLGLSIAHHLVKLMGGKITVQSESGKGSTFAVHLPFELLPDDVPLPLQDGGDIEPNGLSCLVVGGTESLAEYLSAYLRHDGAVVEQAPSLAIAGEKAGTLPPGMWVWVIDAGGEPPSPDDLRAVARAHPEHEFRFAVIGRGQRREPRMRDAGLVLVDGNVLTRKTLLKAVAIAAGRVSAEEETPLSGKSVAEFNPPSREDVLRQGRLILVAEDNETNQKVILRQLALLGQTADIANNGREALELWRSGDYAILFADLHMPEMDGYELTVAIRAAETGKSRIPIIAFTANALKGEAEHCLAVGMDDYLSKPVQLADLKVMLEKWLPVAVSPPVGAASTPRFTASDRGVDAAPTDDALPQKTRGLETSPTTAPTAIDVNALKALVGDDEHMIRELLHDFRPSAARIASELRTACTAGHAAAAGALAHKLKSSARSVGALALGERCAEMEQAGKAGDTAALAVLLPRFEQELASVEGFLDGYLRNSP